MFRVVHGQSHSLGEQAQSERPRVGTKMSLGKESESAQTTGDRQLAYKWNMDRALATVIVGTSIPAGFRRHLKVCTNVGFQISGCLARSATIQDAPNQSVGLSQGPNRWCQSNQLYMVKQ